MRRPAVELDRAIEAAAEALTGGFRIASDAAEVMARIAVEAAAPHLGQVIYHVHKDRAETQAIVTDAEQRAEKAEAEVERLLTDRGVQSARLELKLQQAEANFAESHANFNKAIERAERAEAEVKRLREQIVDYGYADDRALADRLAEALQEMPELRNPFHPVQQALAAWKEARNESQEQFAIEAETQG
jgi:hypothetical protein